MLNFFKFFLNSNKFSEQIIGEYLYVCKFSVVENEFKFERNEPSKAIIKIKINKNGEQEELEIYFERTNKYQTYILTKAPVVFGSEVEYEGFAVKHRALVSFSLNSKSDVFFMRFRESPNGYLFLNTDIREFKMKKNINSATPVKDEIGLLNEIDVHFKKWVSRHKDYYDVKNELEYFATSWQVRIDDEIPLLAIKFGYEENFVRLTIDNYKHYFLSEAKKNL